MVVDARMDMDPDVIRKEQRQFAAVQATVREIGYASRISRKEFVISNVRPDRSRTRGTSPFTLFHLDKRFLLQVLDVPIDGRTDEEVYVLIEARARKRAGEADLFPVRQGTFSFEGGGIKEQYGSGMLGSGEAMEVVLGVINPEPEPSFQPPTAV